MVGLRRVESRHHGDEHHRCALAAVEGKPTSMMKKTAIVGAVASLCLAGTAGGSALGTTHHPAGKHTLKITLSNYHPAQGQTVKATMVHASKTVKYVCLLTTYKKGVALSTGDSFVTSASLNHKANKKGKVKCTQVFIKGTTPNGHHCPPSKKDKHTGWKCGIAIADPAAQGNAHEGKNYAVGLFKF